MLEQGAQCAAFFDDLCAVSECDPAGLEATLACCAMLRTCDVGELMACMFGVLMAGEPERTTP